MILSKLKKPVKYNPQILFIIFLSNECTLTQEKIFRSETKLLQNENFRRILNSF